MKKRTHTRVLIVVADEGEDRRTLSIRGFDNQDNNMKSLTDNMIRTIRKRFPEYADMKPAEVRAALRWYVYEVCTGHGGWPNFVGYASEWIEHGGPYV